MLPSGDVARRFYEAVKSRDLATARIRRVQSAFDGRPFAAMFGG